MNEPDELVKRAIEVLNERGPMKAKKLADALGLPNARSLSMKLQWASDWVECFGGKWKVMNRHCSNHIFVEGGKKKA